MLNNPECWTNNYITSPDRRWVFNMFSQNLCRANAEVRRHGVTVFESMELDLFHCNRLAEKAAMFLELRSLETEVPKQMCV